jgi:hypothetical protein
MGTSSMSLPKREGHSTGAVVSHSLDHYERISTQWPSDQGWRQGWLSRLLCGNPQSGINSRQRHVVNPGLLS